MTDPIADDVRRFLEKNIDSVTQLEVLLHMAANPRPWTPHELADAIGLSDTHMLEIVQGLSRRSLVAHEEGTFRYAPRRRAGEVVDKLAPLYAKYRVRIMTIVFSRPRRVEDDFSDAFRLRADDEDDS